MINDIIKGLGVTEVLNPEITAFSERSGSSTTSRSTTTTTADARYTIALPNGQTASNLTQTQYDTVKALLAIYNEAFALSKENGLPTPSWDTYDTMSNAQNALAKLKAQIQAAQEAAAAEAAAAAQKAAAEAAAQKAAAEMVDGSYWENKSEIEAKLAEKYSATPPEVVLPDIVPTVQPSEKQGGSFPWIAVAIFGAITIGAIALVKSKPKKRR